MSLVGGLSFCASILFVLFLAPLMLSDSICICLRSGGTELCPVLGTSRFGAVVVRSLRDTPHVQTRIALERCCTVWRHQRMVPSQERALTRPRARSRRRPPESFRQGLLNYRRGRAPRGPHFVRALWPFSLGACAEAMLLTTVIASQCVPSHDSASCSRSDTQVPKGFDWTWFRKVGGARAACMRSARARRCRKRLRATVAAKACARGAPKMCKATRGYSGRSLRASGVV